MEKNELIRFINPSDLELILLPTEHCNFRCTYCYEDFEIGQMKPNTIEAIKKLIQARLPKLKRLQISWFGGEPLMAKNVMLEICDFAKTATQAAGVQFSSAAVTNAFALNRDLFNALVDVDVRRYQISIDGDADEHDKTRKLISGRGTFQRIWDNLISLRSSKERFTILLRIHIHTENIASLRRLLPKIQHEFGADDRFTISLKTVGNWGGESVKAMNLVKNPAEAIKEFNTMLVDLGWFENRPSSNEKASINPCYAAKPNSLVIRADGRLAKCTVAFNDERNNIGHINDDGTVVISNEKVHSFMRGFKSMEERELLCPMSNMPAAKDVKVIKFEKRINTSQDQKEEAVA